MLKVSYRSLLDQNKRLREALQIMKPSLWIGCLVVAWGTVSAARSTQ